MKNYQVKKTLLLTGVELIRVIESLNSAIRDSSDYNLGEINMMTKHYVHLANIYFENLKKMLYGKL